MKKMFLMAAMAVASMTANAQMWIGGSVGADFDHTNNSKTVSKFTLSPEVGYNLNEKFAVAMAINYNLTNTNPKVGVAHQVHTFSVAPYARYFFAQSGKVGFFVDGGVICGINRLGGHFGGDMADATLTVGAGLRPGVALSLNDKVTLVAKLGYLGYIHEEGEYDFDGSKGARHNKFGFGIDNNSLSFGIYYAF